MEFYFVPFNQLSLSDLYAILQLRQEVFVLEQTCLYPDIDGNDDMAYHAMLKIDGKLVAYARYFSLGSLYVDYASIGRVLVHAGFRKRQLGHHLLKNTLRKIETSFDAAPIKIAAQTYLLNFYEQYGFKKISAEYLEDDIPHIDMLKA